MKSVMSLLCFGVLCAGCGPQGSDPSLSPRKGALCTVYFRSDVLGKASDLPTSAGTDSINGAKVSLSGKYVSQDDRWFVVFDNGEDHWIPRENILMVQVRR